MQENINITEDQFLIYLEIQRSGALNMFDVTGVVEIACGELTRKDVFYIMKNYHDLFNKYKSAVAEGVR